MSGMITAILKIERRKGFIALDGEAGFQAELLRGGLHIGLWRFQYRLHKVPLVTIRQGRIGYVYARDGEALPPSQTLGRIVGCNNFISSLGVIKPLLYQKNRPMNRATTKVLSSRPKRRDPHLNLTVDSSTTLGMTPFLNPSPAYGRGAGGEGFPAIYPGS